MSTEPTTTPPTSPTAASPAPDPGLWRLRWFRVLTIVNAVIVVVSAIGAIAEAPLDWSITGWMFLTFPVVPALFAMPFLWFVVLAFAVVFSLVHMVLVPGAAGARFLRALTVWGTIVLGIPIAFTALGAIVSVVGDLVNR